MMELVSPGSDSYASDFCLQVGAQGAIREVVRRRGDTTACWHLHEAGTQASLLGEFAVTSSLHKSPNVLYLC